MNKMINYSFPILRTLTLTLSQRERVRGYFSNLLWRRLFVRQDVASVGRAGDVDRHVAFVDVLNDPVLVDHERGAISIAAIFVEDAVVFHDRLFDVAQQWERDGALFGELSVGIRTVDAHAENLCIVAFEFGDISLIRLHFLR